MDNIRNETIRGFEGIKSAAEQSLKAITDEAKKNMDDVCEETNAACEELRKSTEKNIKKQVQTIVKEQSRLITVIEKESVGTIKDTWAMSKSKLLGMLDATKIALGKHISDLEKILKEIIKFMDSVVHDCIKMIRDYAKLMQEQLKHISQKYIKYVALSRILEN